MTQYNLSDGFYFVSFYFIYNVKTVQPNKKVNKTLNHDNEKEGNSEQQQELHAANTRLSSNT